MPNLPASEKWSEHGYRFEALPEYRPFRGLELPWDDAEQLKASTDYLVKFTRSRAVVNLEPGRFGTPGFLFVKRYRFKSWVGKLLHGASSTRAREEWNLGWSLLAAGLNTPRPVWLAEEKRFPRSFCLLATEDLRFTHSVIERWRAASSATERDELLVASGKYLLEMHTKMFLHDDGKAEHYRLPDGKPPAPKLFYVLDLLGGRLGKELSDAERALNLYQFTRSFYPKNEDFSFEPRHRRLLFEAYLGSPKNVDAWDARVIALARKKGRAARSA